MKWWTYHNQNISLSSDFKGYSVDQKSMSKKEFLEALITTKYIPIKASSDASNPIYHLHPLSASAVKDIGITVKNESITKLQHHNMEGKPLPNFEFSDLNGNKYSNETIKGKTVVLKTWFINCTACVAEFPELNEFVEEHHRDDVLFLSLATDSQEKLEVFLEKKPFNYAVVAEQNKYISKSLGFQSYPTHIVVGKDGNVLKVVGKAEDMIAFLKQSLG